MNAVKGGFWWTSTRRVVGASAGALAPWASTVVGPIAATAIAVRASTVLCALPVSSSWNGCPVGGHVSPGDVRRTLPLQDMDVDLDRVARWSLATLRWTP